MLNVGKIFFWRLAEREEEKNQKKFLLKHIVGNLHTLWWVDCVIGKIMSFVIFILLFTTKEMAQFH